MMTQQEAQALAPQMRREGYVDVSEVLVAYDWHGVSEWQVEATNPRTGVRVYMPNPQVYDQKFRPVRCAICHDTDGHTLSCPTRWYR